MIVATYARVSTKLDAQKSSMINQEEMFNKKITKHDDWEIYKHYRDHGKSGTSSKHRTEFLQMIEDAKNKKFDILIAKSMTRFGRNRADTSNTLVKILFPLGIRVIFLEEKLDSINKEDKSKMGLFEWLAEIESRKISDRVGMYINQLKEKKLFPTNRPPYGYSLKNHQLTINSQEAEVVKKIYNLYLSGYGITKIVTTLDDQGIKPKSANKWSNTTIKIILNNGNYTGNLHINKTKISDPIDKEILRFDKDQWVIIENTHEPIIDIDTFNKTQEEILKRRDMFADNIKHSGIHLFSTLIRCGRCGAIYTRKKVHGKYYVYTCSNYERLGLKVCTREVVTEEVLINKILKRVDKILKGTYDVESIYNKKSEKIEPIDKKQVENKIKEINILIEKLKQKKDNLVSSYYGENELSLTNDEYIKYVNQIQNDITKNNEIKNILTIQLNENNQKENIKSKFIERISILNDPKSWNNKILKELIKEIEWFDINNWNIEFNLK